MRDKSKIKSQAEDIVKYLREKYMFSSGIIYCLSRQECEELCAELSEFQIKCDYYHAMMTDSSRKDV